MELIDTGQIADSEDQNVMRKRYGCCCQCHIKQRLPPVNETRVRSPFLNSKIGSDERNRNPIRGKLKTKLRTSSSWRQTKDCKFSDSYRTRTENRNRKKSSRWISTEECQTNFLCQKFKSLFRKRQQRMRIMCHCVIFVIILTFCGVIMYSDSRDDKDYAIDYYPDSDRDEDYYSSGSSNNVILDVPFKSVPINEFEKHLDESKSIADLLRIFFDQKDLSDIDINTIMNMKSNKYIYGSHHKRENTRSNWMNDDEDVIADRAAAFEHHIQMANSPLGSCRYPLPEIEYVRSVEEDTFRHYYPRCTVVHRCRNYTGCCPNGEVCGPKKDNGIRIFTKAFLVFEVVPGTDNIRPARRHFVEKRMFIDHIECECIRVDYRTNCDKRCPQQFTKKRHGIDCECDCAHHAKYCKYIHKGHLPLEERDLECIKAGECIKPNCAEGEFRIHTGFCPQARRHHRRKDE